MRQNEESVYPAMSFMWLLFEKKSEIPNEKQFIDRLNNLGYETNSIWESNDHSMQIIYLPQYKVDFDDAKGVPYQLMIRDFHPVENSHGDDLARAQFWRTSNGVELLDSCKWQVMIGDFMSSSHPPKVRANILSDWLEIALEVFPDCKAVFFESSQNIMTAEALKANPYEGPDRFFYGAVNARFFKIEGTDDMLVDTLGLHTLGVSDVQFHFQGLDPNAVVNQAYNIGMYQIENDMPIKDGETVDGFDEEGNIRQDIQWKCQYEMSMIEPKRVVLDIEAGEFASGNRK